MNFRTTAIAGLLLALTTMPALAQKNYGPGASDTQVKIGTIGALSDPAAAASVVTKSFAAYFDKINADDDGINGRKIYIMTADDGADFTRAMALTQKLVEQDGVLFMAGASDNVAQRAAQQYLNDLNVPQLFLATRVFGDPLKSPWTIGFAPSAYTEGRLVGKYVSATMPGAKIAVLFQDDDAGKDLLRGAKETLSNGAAIVAQQSNEPANANVDSEIASLQASGADVLFAFATPKTATQAIQHAAKIGWNPKLFIPSTDASISLVLQPAGLENARNVFTASFMKDTTSPSWAKDTDVQEFTAWMKKYDSSVDTHDRFAAVEGYVIGALTEKILQAAGNDLSRENILKQATNLHDVALPMLLPGITINTSPSDNRPIRQLQFEAFDGENWAPIGDIVSD